MSEVSSAPPSSASAPRPILLPLLTAAVLLSLSGCGAQSVAAPKLTPLTKLQQSPNSQLHEELAKTTAASPGATQRGPGLVGVMGGVRVKVFGRGVHRLLLPMPLMVDCQTPLSYSLRCKPSDTVAEFQIERRDDQNDVISASLNSDANQEIAIEWSAVVLITGSPANNRSTPAEAYRAPTVCVQSDSDVIRSLAEQLWPAGGEAEDYAKRIQQHVREMKQVKPPSSLDAVGILQSGASGICTANANLALALMRAKGIACRSLAVVPPITHRLEMHRIVEYHHHSEWRRFDPSGVSADVPMNPWQTVVLATTTPSDENVAMTPRMSSMRGCPYGQEAELLTSAITLWGQDFFWTIATPLAEFEADEEAISLAKKSWIRFREEGKLSEGQIKASAARSSDELVKLLKAGDSD